MATKDLSNIEPENAPVPVEELSERLGVGPTNGVDEYQPSNVFKVSEEGAFELVEEADEDPGAEEFTPGEGQIIEPVPLRATDGAIDLQTAEDIVVDEKPSEKPARKPKVR